MNFLNKIGFAHCVDLTKSGTEIHQIYVNCFKNEKHQHKNLYVSNEMKAAPMVRLTSHFLSALKNCRVAQVLLRQMMSTLDEVLVKHVVELSDWTLYREALYWQRNITSGTSKLNQMEEEVLLF